MAKFILYVLLFLGNLFAYTSCVKDGEELDDCKQYVQFIYDYNMSYVDLFSQQATKMNLYIYDSDGKYVSSLLDERQPFFPNDYKMTLPDHLADGTYTLVAWSGLYDDSYDYLVPSVGESLSDFNLKVKNYESASVGFKMKPLWHGKTEIQFNRKSVATHTVSLMKDVKIFRIILQDLTTGSQRPDVNNYDFQILAANGMYDHENTVSGHTLAYTPYHTYTDSLAGAVAELNTQRLMKNANNRLRIVDKRTNEDLIDVSLDHYLAALRLQQYESIPLQEYLDRVDFYGIIFIFKNTGSGGNIALEVWINDWFIREQHEDL